MLIILLKSKLALVEFVIIESEYLYKKKIKNFIIFIIIFLTLGNLFTETTVQQFFKQRLPHKPQYVLALKNINQSKYNNFAFNLSFADKNHYIWDMAMNNYFNQIIIKEKLNINHIKIENIKNESYFWYICLADLNTSICDIIDNPKFKILDEKNYNNANLKLIKLLN